MRLQNPVNRRSKKNADGVHKIIGRDKLAFFLFAASLLQKRVQRHREQAGGKPQQDKGSASARIGRSGKRDQAETNPHGNRTERHQAQFNMIARQPTGRETAQADAHRQERSEQPDVKFVQMQQFFAEEKNVDLNERPEEPEIRNSDHGKPERSLGSQTTQTVDDFAKGIEK